MTRKSFLIVLLCFLLCLLWYKNTHQAEIASYLGDYYFRKNNMQKAQTYFERRLNSDLMIQNKEICM